MSLLDLSTEVLDLVLDHTLPYDFESIVLSCKDLYNICQPRIDAHNQYRAVFRHIRYSDRHNVGMDERRWLRSGSHKAFELQSSIDLLAHFAKDPRIGRWVITADLISDEALGYGLQAWYASNAPSRSQEVENAEAIKRNYGRILTIVLGYATCADISGLFADSPVLKEAWPEQSIIVDKECRLDFARVDDIPISILCLVLSVLPNILCVRMPGGLRYRRLIERAFPKLIIEAAIEAYHSGHSGSLTKLKRLEHNHCAPRLQHDALPFTGLPKLTSLDRVDIFDSSQDPGRWTWCGALTSIAIGDDMVCLNELGFLLRQIKQVKRLTYAVVPGICQQDCILSLLSMRHGDSIVALQLHDDENLWGPGPDPWDGIELNLSSFRSLERLSLSYRLILWSMTDMDRLPFSLLSGQDLPLVSERFRGRILSQFLPPRLIEFALHGDGKYRTAMTIDAMFYDFAANRSKCPYLKLVTITEPGSTDSYYTEARKELDVALAREGVCLSTCDLTIYEEDWSRWEYEECLKEVDAPACMTES